MAKNLNVLFPTTQSRSLCRRSSLTCLPVSQYNSALTVCPCRDPWVSKIPQAFTFLALSYSEHPKHLMQHSCLIQDYQLCWVSSLSCCETKVKGLHCIKPTGSPGSHTVKIDAARGLILSCWHMQDLETHIFRWLTLTIQTHLRLLFKADSNVWAWLL